MFEVVSALAKECGVLLVKSAAVGGGLYAGFLLADTAVKVIAANAPPVVPVEPVRARKKKDPAPVPASESQASTPDPVPAS